MKKSHLFSSLLMMILVVVVVSMMGLTPSKVHAQTATSSALSDESLEETTANLKDRIERIVTEKRDQIKGTIDEILTDRRGFIGEVTRVNQDTLTINNRKGTQIIGLEGINVLVEDGEEIAVEDISVGDWVIVIGTFEDDTVVPKRVEVSSQTLRPRNHLVDIGSLSELDRAELVLQSRRGQEVVMSVTTSTQYQDAAGEALERTDIPEATQILVVGFEDEDNEKTATVVRTLVSAAELEVAAE